MSELFPEMLGQPEKGTVIASVIYWPICYVLIPFVTTVLNMAFQDSSVISVIEIAYYVINAASMICLFSQYIKDSFLTVQVSGKSFFQTTGIVAGIMVFLALGYIAMGYRSGFMAALNLFPITETSVLTSAAFLLLKQPVIGLLCTVLLNPFTVGCLFYATVFAPVSENHPRLAYLVMALVLLIPRIFNIWWLGFVGRELWIYFLQLPFHLLACWSYQKTDSIWAPIISVSAVNLISAGFLLLLQSAGMIRVN